jgi:hypothetical protein
MLTLSPSQLIPCDPRRHADIDGFIVAVRDGTAPPILVVKNTLAKRDVYFVADGHHRVGAAYLLQMDIRAEELTCKEDLAKLPQGAPVAECESVAELESQLRKWMQDTYGRQVTWRKYLRTPMVSYAPVLHLGPRFY